MRSRGREVLELRQGEESNGPQKCVNIWTVDDNKRNSGSFLRLASQRTCRQFPLIIWLHKHHCPL